MSDSGDTGERLAHGYTNDTRAAQGFVVKEYLGVDAADRLRTEVAALTRAAGVVPVPTVTQVDEQHHRLVLTLSRGRHGQELIDEGHAPAVLASTGRTLRRLHDGLEGLVHGDYGPQNMLFDPETYDVTAVLDWELSGRGDPLDDLAWAEWIVRMHHADATTALPALFAGYGSEPSWEQRRGTMVRKCESLEEVCRRRGHDDAVEMWHRRAQITHRWTTVRSQIDVADQADRAAVIPPSTASSAP